MNWWEILKVKCSKCVRSSGVRAVRGQSEVASSSSLIFYDIPHSTSDSAGKNLTVVIGTCYKNHSLYVVNKLCIIFRRLKITKPIQLKFIIFFFYSTFFFICMYDEPNKKFVYYRCRSFKILPHEPLSWWRHWWPARDSGHWPLTWPALRSAGQLRVTRAAR